MKLTILAVLSLFTFTISAQRPQGKGGKGAPRDWSKMPKNGRVFGRIMDANLNEALSFATISLSHLKDSTIVTGGIANERGWVDIEGLTYGPWKMTVSFIGYEDKELPMFILNPRQSTKDLGVIEVSPSSETLEEVNIVAERSLVEIKIDKKVIDVSKDLTNIGGSAEEVLQNMPGVEVDMDGNISLRGNTNVTVLIDGKPSSLTGGSRKAVISQIPADAIEKVEIITNPSAKYDPDGMSGILNIILKKNKLKGFSGNVAANYGFNDNYNGNAGLNYRNKKWNLYSNYAYRRSDRFRVVTSDRALYLGDSTSTLDQDTDGSSVKENHTISAGVDYNLTPKSVLSVSGNMNLRDELSNEVVDFRNFNNSNTLDNFYQRFNDGLGNAFSYTGNVAYDLEMKKEGRKLSTYANYSLREGEGDDVYRELYLNLDGTEDYALIPYFQNQQRTESITNLLYALDYTHSMKKDAKFETGVKYTGRLIGQDMKLFEDTLDIDNPVLDENQSNNFEYNEQVMAAYGTYGRSYKKFEYQVGLRAEAVLTNSKLVTSNEDFENNYNSLYPSAHVSYKASVKNTFSLSYSRRVNRPGYHSLNPFRDVSDPFNVRTGNPFLRPEYINSYELGYIRYFEKGMISASAYYKTTTEMIQRLKQVDSSGVSTLTWANYSGQENIGVEMNLNVSPVKWLRLNGSFNIYQNKVDAGNLETTTDMSNTALGYFGRVSASYIPNKKLSVQLSGFYRGRRIFAIGYMDPMLGMDLGARYQLIDKKLSVNIKLKDMFDTRQFQIHMEEPTYRQDLLWDWQSRFLFVGLDYRFGNMKVQKKRRRNMAPSDMGGGGGMM